MAVALSAALAQGQSQERLAKLGAFFTIVGDTLALYALEPGSMRPAASRARTAAAEAETAAALSLADNL